MSQVLEGINVVAEVASTGRFREKGNNATCSVCLAKLPDPDDVEAHAIRRAIAAVGGHDVCPCCNQFLPIPARKLARDHTGLRSRLMNYVGDNDAAADKFVRNRLSFGEGLESLPHAPENPVARHVAAIGLTIANRRRRHAV